jgi:hypothetical protein
VREQLINARRLELEFLQGLKPIFIRGLSGTTEVVP